MGTQPYDEIICYRQNVRMLPQPQLTHPCHIRYHPGTKPGHIISMSAFTLHKQQVLTNSEDQPPREEKIPLHKQGICPSWRDTFLACSANATCYARCPVRGELVMCCLATLGMALVSHMVKIVSFVHHKASYGLNPRRFNGAAILQPTKLAPTR